MAYINNFIYYKEILEKHPDNFLLKYCIDEYEKHLIEYLKDFIDKKENVDINKEKNIEIISSPINKFINYILIKSRLISPIIL